MSRSTSPVSIWIRTSFRETRLPMSRLLELTRPATSLFSSMVNSAFTSTVPCTVRADLPRTAGTTCATGRRR
ncbi:MAG: hypothetical protein HYV75_00045 [Opitutae bacterium]|nr:hypothetical protein [Opitutae bacterium]